jgi:hypothetical protein
MNMPERDYKKLYSFQEKFLSWWRLLDMPFYLTGGTALGRFFLHHRYSEDLDFFINAHPDFLKLLEKIRSAINKSFDTDTANALITSDYARFFISDGYVRLKIDFVNDVEKYVGKTIGYSFGKVDNPLNILTNKLSAIAGRDEPKDYFDILQISVNYAFNWKEVFLLAKEKALLNELEISEQLSNFQTDSFRYVDWLIHPIDFDLVSHQMEILNNDFLFGRDNSLGAGKQEIDQIRAIAVE